MHSSGFPTLVQASGTVLQKSLTGGGNKDSVNRLILQTSVRANFCTEVTEGLNNVM